MSRGPTAPLRSLDWRYLMPSPAGDRFRRLAILGGTPAQVAAAVAAGVADTVVTRLEPPHDAVAVLDGADADPAAVAAALADDGAVYWEVDRRRPGRRTWTPARLRRALRAGGCESSAIYAVTPHLAHPHTYLPLAGPGPLRWFLGALYLADTPARYTARLALATFASSRIGMRSLGTVVPCFCVVAAKRAGSVVPSVVGSAALPTRLRVPTSETLILTWGRNDSNRVAMLPFAPGAERPAYVLKVSRDAAFAEATEDEQRALGIIHPRLVGALADTVPRPLGTFPWQGVPIGAESCVPGRLLASRLGAWGTTFSAQVDGFDRAVNWLIDFHRQVRLCDLRWDGAAIERFVDAPLRSYAESLGLVGGEAELFAAVRARAEALRGATLPEVWRHMGYSGINIYLDAETVHVIDWESGGPGLPLLDLLGLAIDWSSVVARARTEDERLDDFERTLLGQPAGSRCAPAVARALDHYFDRVGLPPAFLPPIHVLFHVHRALGYVDQTGRQPGVRAENVYARYVERLARHASRLFRA